MSEKQLFQEREALKSEAFDGDSKHCRDCIYFRKTTDGYGTGDSPTLYDCECDDATQCLAVEAVYSEMDRLKGDSDVNEEALENISQDIVDFADSNNPCALLITVQAALRHIRFQTAKDNELL